MGANHTDMGRSTTPSFVLETPLPPDPKAEALFDREASCAKSVYNYTLDRLLGRLSQLKQDKRFRALLKEKRETKDKKRLAAINTELRELDKKYGLTQYSGHTVAREFARVYPFFGAMIAEKIGARAYKVVQAYRYGEAKKVRFKGKNDDMSFSGKSNTDTMRFVVARSILILCKTEIHVPIDPADTLLQYCLQHNRIKYVSIVCRNIRGRKRYYLQFTFGGSKPLTRGQQKILAAIQAAEQQSLVPYAKKIVGYDAGVSTVAAVTAGHAVFFELCPEVQAEKEHIAQLQRAMDRSRRATNPDNYNPDGTCKKRAEQKPWVYSNSYQEMQQQLHDKQHKLAAKRKQSHRLNAMALAAFGGDARVEHMDYAALAKRSTKPTEINGKTGRYKRKRRFGNSITQNAPGLFFRLLEYYVTLFGGTFREVNNYTVKASQYNPVTGEYVKHALIIRWILVGDTWLQRDLLAAYLLSCTDEELKSINAQLARDGLAAFIKLHDELLHDLTETKNLSRKFRWYFRCRPPKQCSDAALKSCEDVALTSGSPSSEPSKEKLRPVRNLSDS